MRKPILLIGRTEIIAAIYNPSYLPSAVLCARDPSQHSDRRPHCLHALRSEDLTFFDQEMSRFKHHQGLENKPETDEEVKAWLFPFFEDYPAQDDVCNACHYSDKMDISHVVGQSKEFCTKSTEACA